MLMKSRSAPFLVIPLLLLNLTACSVIGGYFPDKAKDYQLSSELPPLNIPTDIANKGLVKAKASKPVEDTETVAVIGEVVKAPPVATTETTTAPIVETEPEKPEPTRVELVKFADGETRLQMNKPVAMSWRMIGKALSRKAIEITARDQANAEFTVQYDPNETDFKDDTFWDEITFVFSEDHNQEQPYHLKLLARDKTTEVAVLDAQGKPLATGGGLSLLKLLLTTLKADLSDK